MRLSRKDNTKRDLITFSDFREITKTNLNLSEFMDKCLNEIALDIYKFYVVKFLKFNLNFVVKILIPKHAPIQHESKPTQPIEQQIPQITQKEQITNDIIENTEEEQLFIKTLPELLDYTDPTNDLTYALELYHKISEDRILEVMLEVWNMTHSRHFYSHTPNKELRDWINKYPDIVKSKIKAYKRKLKRANRTEQEKKKLRETYMKNIEFRLQQTIRSLQARGYNAITPQEVRELITAYPNWNILDYVNDLIESFRAGDLVDIGAGEDENFIERENSEFEEHIDFMQNKYKYSSEVM